MDRLRRVIDYALSNGATYAEVRHQVDEVSYVLVKNGQVDAVGTSVDSGFAVRVLADGAWGFASTTNEKELELAVDKALKLARATSRLRRRPVILSDERTYVVKYEHKVLKEPATESMVEFLRELDRRIAEVDERLRTRILSARYTVTEKTFVNSEGAIVESKVPRLLITYKLILVDPSRGSQQRSVEYGSSGGLENLVGVEERAVEESRMLARLVDEGRTLGSAQRMDVVFGPEVAGIMVHESVGHPIELDRIMGREGAEAGESYARAEDLGKLCIGSSIVNVIDDPTIPRSYGFYLFDDEGVMARPRYLVRNGCLNEPLTNREYAAYLGIRSTAAARASSYSREPIPRMANTYLAPGDWDPEEVIRDTKRGVYFRKYEEWNIDDRRWNARYGSFEAWYIEGGELKHLLRNVFVEVDTKTLWTSVDAVAKDLEFSSGECGKGNPHQTVPVWFGGPTFRARNLLVLPPS